MPNVRVIMVDTVAFLFVGGDAVLFATAVLTGAAIASAIRGKPVTRALRYAAMLSAIVIASGVAPFSIVWYAAFVFFFAAWSLTEPKTPESVRPRWSRTVAAGLATTALVGLAMEISGRFSGVSELRRPMRIAVIGDSLSAGLETKGERP